MTRPGPDALTLRTGIGPGPRMARLRRRSVLMWALAGSGGLVLAGASGSPLLGGFGLGVAFPGAGFLAAGAWWWTLLTLALLAASIVGWIGVGGFVFPVAVWLGAAVVAGLVAGEPASRGDVALVLAVVGAAVLVRIVAGLVLARRRRDEAAALSVALARVEPRAVAMDVPAIRELDDTDLACARYVLDRALQPLEQFEGFTTIDQFREAAWRYQLVSMNYALASLQVNATPAFRGYLHQAQVNAIAKMLDRRAWWYWRVENLIGNGRIGRDPIRRENIMLSGWWALALGAFERATGDHRFSEPGALTFVESEHCRFVYDYPTIVDTLVEQFDERELSFFPCEPNWVFAICNLFGVTGVLLHDREHGTTHARSRLERLTEVLEREFTTADGRFVLLASRRTGWRVPSGSPISPVSLAWLTSMVSPRLAQTYWHIGRHRMLQACDGDLDRFEPPLASQVDPGNYRPNGIFFWATTMASAREMGDDELYQLARERFERDAALEDGALVGAGSVYANLTAHHGRFGSEGTWHRFAWGDVPASTRTGPFLDDVRYPDVLVAHADNDGTALSTVLVPGAGPVRTSVVVRGLRPGGRYRVDASGDEVVADPRGCARVDLDLGARTRLTIAPST